jgi:hypothetical protein
MLTADAARRIGRAVASHERGNRDIHPPAIRTAGDEGDPVRLCKTSADWAKGSTATLDIWESGTPPSETQTTGETLAGVVNKVCDVKSGSFVIVAKAMNGSWYLAEAGNPDNSGCRAATVAGEDLTKLAGYNASKTQVLGHESGCLKWIDAEDCPT